MTEIDIDTSLVKCKECGDPTDNDSGFCDDCIIKEDGGLDGDIKEYPDNLFHLVLEKLNRWLEYLVLNCTKCRRKYGLTRGY